MADTYNVRTTNSPTVYSEVKEHEARETRVLMRREQLDETFYSFPKISTGPKGKHWTAKNAFENPVPDLAGVVLDSWTIRLQSKSFTVLGACARVVGRHGEGSRRHPNQPGYSWKRRRLQRPIPGLLRVAIRGLISFQAERRR